MLWVISAEVRTHLHHDITWCPVGSRACVTLSNHYCNRRGLVPSSPISSLGNSGTIVCSVFIIILSSAILGAIIDADDGAILVWNGNGSFSAALNRLVSWTLPGAAPRLAAEDWNIAGSTMPVSLKLESPPKPASGCPDVRGHDPQRKL